jgi:regulatory protein
VRLGPPSKRPASKPAVSLHEAALRLLSRRAYSRKEVCDRLEARGYPAAAVRDELTSLESAGFLNDTVLAETVVSSQLARGRGKRAVEVALRRRGVPRHTREAAVETLSELDEAAALARAIDAALVRHPGWPGLLHARRKVIRYLLARGFDPGQVRAALAERAHAVQEEQDAGKPDDLRDP